MSDGLKLIVAAVQTQGVSLLRDLSDDLFIDNERAVWAYVKRHFRRHGVYPSLNTVEEDTGVEMPEAEEPLDFYLGRVNDRKLYGAIRDRYNQLRDALRDFDMDAAREVIDSMRLATRVVRSDNDVRNFSEVMRAVRTLYDDAHMNPGVSGVPSGWPSYDGRVSGYQPGDLISLVARPGMGKTYIMLIQVYFAWLAGFNVLVVSMEMTVEQLGRRIAGIAAGINPEYIRRGQLSTYAVRRLDAFINALEGHDRLHFYSGGFKKKVSDVDTLAQELQPDIIFIDGVYLMRTESTRAMSRVEAVTEIFDSLKQVAIARNLPIYVTTQLNRAAGKKGKEASLETIAYSDAISTHSSIVVSLAEGDAPHQRTRRKLIILKGREGEHGEFVVNYRFAPIDFSEVPPDDLEFDEDGQPLVRANTEATDTTSLDWMG